MNLYETEDMFLPATHPFRWSECMAYLTRSADECLFHIEDDKVYRLVRVAASSAWIEVAGREDGVMVRILAVSSPIPDLETSIAAFVREWLDLDTNLHPFYRQMDGCPVMRPLVRAYEGLRLVGVPDLFEALCWAIMGQQINLAFAYTLKRRFVTSFGESHAFGGRVYSLFPTPSRIATLTVEDLLALQCTRMKSEYIIDVAKRMTDGTLSKSALLGLGDFREAERQLISIRGIGPWTANYVLMRCLRDKSAFPIADVGLQNAVKARLELAEKPTIEELKSLATAWIGWEAYATFYLWRSLQQTVS